MVWRIIGWKIGSCEPTLSFKDPKTKITRQRVILHINYVQCKPVAWWEWSCWGGSLINGAPQSYFFCLLVWDVYHVVGTTCNDRRSLRNIFEWMRALQAPSSSMVESWWRSRGLSHLKLQRICILRYLILGLMLPNNRWMVIHFFMCIAVQSHRKIPKVQSFQF